MTESSQTPIVSPISSTDLTFKQATQTFRQFVTKRDWQKYHTPRNLVMALVGEVGQIAQIFQWKGEVETGLLGWSQKQKIHVGQEIADVMSYLLRLADVCGIDIEEAIKNKLQKNKNKYPEDKVKEDRNYLLSIKQQRREKRQNQKNGGNQQEALDKRTETGDQDGKHTKVETQ